MALFVAFFCNVLLSSNERAISRGWFAFFAFLGKGGDGGVFLPSRYSLYPLCETDRNGGVRKKYHTNITSSNQLPHFVSLFSPPSCVMLDWLGLLGR
jgi:hypothetical protein